MAALVRCYCAREAAVANVAPLFDVSFGSFRIVKWLVTYRTHCVGDDLDLEVGHDVVEEGKEGKRKNYTKSSRGESN